METKSRRCVFTALTVLVAFFLLPAMATAQTQLFKLTHTGAAASERFGVSCDISGDRAIVGVDWDHIAGMNSGSASIYDVSTGQELFKLIPAPRQPFMTFGYSVAIDGDRAVVGAYAYGYALVNSGAAYVYDVATGERLQLLIPADIATGDYFGTSVAIGESYVVVGAPGDTPHGGWSGSVYVFDRSTGQELRKLVPSDGNADDNFGGSVAVTGDRIVVGAFYDDPNGWTSGSAYVFEASTGQELFKIFPSDGEPADLFGWRVAADGDLALIGAYLDDDQGTDSGSAYLFDVNTGQQVHKLLPNNGAAGTSFGYDVSIRGGVALVGRPLDHTSGTKVGCAHSFDVSTGLEYGQLLSSDGQSGDQFGWSVGIDGAYAVIGAPSRANLSGVAYLFIPLPLGVPYCFGDQGVGTPCPCANENDGSVPGSGCANGAFASGAQLTAEGMPSVSEDSLVLTTTGLDPSNSGLYFQGNNAVNGGDGILFGDGLRCAGGGLIRLQIRASNAAGVSSTTVSIAEKGGVIPGDIKRYQCWYRDNSGSQPCGAGVSDFNLSNGFQIIWRP